MSSFAALLFTLHLGLGASPLDGARVSLREEALAVAAEVEPAPLVPTPGAGSLAAPAELRAPRRALTREDWLDLLDEALANERLAGAAMWIATQPLSVTMTSEKVFVSVRFATP
jgi:hypothetical protein